MTTISLPKLTFSAFRQRACVTVFVPGTWGRGRSEKTRGGSILNNKNCELMPLLKFQAKETILGQESIFYLVKTLF